MYNQSVNSHCKLNLQNIYYLAFDLLLKIPVKFWHSLVFVVFKAFYFYLIDDKRGHSYEVLI